MTGVIKLWIQPFTVLLNLRKILCGGLPGLGSGGFGGHVCVLCM